MPRHVPKLKDSGSSASYRLEMTGERGDERRAVLTQALGGALTKQQEAALVEICDRYLALADVEAQAPTVQAAISELDDLLSKSRSLMGALGFNDPQDASRNEALGQIKSSLDETFRHMAANARDDASHRARGGLCSTDELWRSLVFFGEAALQVRRELTGEQLRAYSEAAEGTAMQDSTAWPLFVRDLEAFYKSLGRKASAQNDYGEQAKTSPFVLFVEAVQNVLPAYKRPSNSLGALSQAINRARRSVG